MSKSIEYRFRMVLEAQESNIALINFLKGNDTLAFTEKEKLFSALLAYWLPFALRDSECSDEELKKCAKSAVYRLKLHISYLVESFGLDLEDTILQSTILQSAPTSKPVPSVAQIPKVNADLQVSTAKEVLDNASQPDIELIHNEDDDTFEGLFNS